jgi:uncharacterized protein (DUF433 family)
MIIAPGIEVDPEICGGKPCIANTRLAVSIILEYLEYGKSFNDILESYPFLTEENIRDVIRYVRNLVEGEDVIPFEMAP